MTPRSFTSSARIASSSAIVCASSSYSSRSFWRSSAASRRSAMSRMWVACISLNSNGASLQRLLRRVGRFRAADQRDDRVDHVERLEQALEDVRAVARLVQPVLAAPGDDLDLVRDVHLERLRAGSSSRGTPSTSATMFAAKFVCIGVCL